VHRDRGEDEPADERGQARQVAREAAEGEQEPAHEEPGVERQARQAGLRSDGDRRVVRGGGLRLAALQVGELRVGALEAADPYACDGMVHGELGSLANQLPTAARGAVQPTAVAEDVVAHIGHGESSDRDDHRRYRRDRDPAPAPGEDRGEHDADDERREARLRVGEEESRPDRRDRDGAADQQAPVAAEEDGDEAGKDRDDEEAPVDRRIPKDGVDAVERRVGVADLDLRIPEDVPRLVLVDPDRREHERHRRHLGEQHERPEPVPFEPGERDGQQAEGKVEEEQVDRPLPQVAGPEDRETRPGSKGGERPGDHGELPRDCRTRSVPQVPGKQEGGRGDHPVERHEQVRLGRADSDVDPGGHAGERHER